MVYGYAIDHLEGVIVFDTGVGADSALIDEIYEPDLRLLDQALTAGAGVIERPQQMEVTTRL